MAISEQPQSLADIVDLDRFPLHQPDSSKTRTLVKRCAAALHADGMFDLPGLLRPGALATLLQRLRPLIDNDSFSHRRRHNIYFLATVPGLAPDHPALQQMETSNRTVCADQLEGSELLAIYRWAPLRDFLAAVIGVAELNVMDDPLARVNVMSYRHGEALGWHFDRSEFTTTLLLQQPTSGGVFEFRTNLRSNDSPNHDGVGMVVAGLDQQVRHHHPEPGTLTVFAGHDTAHRVTASVGERDRVVAVFSFYEQPGVIFSPAERLGFYGRA